MRLFALAQAMTNDYERFGERGEAEMSEALVPIVDRREIARPGAAAVVAPEVTRARRASASRPDPGAIRDRRGTDYACTDRHRNRRRRADNRGALQRGARRPGHLVPGRVSVTVQDASDGDTATLPETLIDHGGRAGGIGAAGRSGG